MLLLTALPLTGAAEAQSLRDARAKAAVETSLEREAIYTRSVCGNEIRAEIDWASAGDWQTGLLVAECDKALGALEAACRSGDAEAKRVTRFVCAGDGGGPEINGATLRYGAARDSDGFAETKEAFSGD